MTYKAQQQLQAEAEHKDPTGRICVPIVQASYIETLYT
jgi:hypothetical protein